MNLLDLDTAEVANTGSVLTLKHPADRTPLMTDDDKPVTFTLLGKDSDIFIKAERVIRNKRMEILKKGGKFSAAEEDMQGIETLARCMVAWSGVPQGWVDGTDSNEPAPFSFQSAVKLLGRPGLSWVRTQVDEFVGGTENFLKPSNKS